MKLDSYMIFIAILCTPNDKVISFRFFLLLGDFIYKVRSFWELF
jgi:hypothetical protein